MNDRSDLHDDHDPLEQQLRAHLARRADQVDGPSTNSDVLVDLRREATTGHASVRRRRVGVASVTGVAAVALAVGLIISNQSPQPVNSIDDPADAPSLAGVATGSSTGSTTGAEKGWSTDASTDPTSVDIPALTLSLPQATNDQLSSMTAMTTTRGSGRPAAPLAVLAQLEVGVPLRFVTASVQDPDQLATGSGGLETTISDRPARVIVDSSGWTRIIWSMDDEHQVLVQSYGVDRSTAEALATTLRTDDSGEWVMDAGASGLGPVPTPAPDGQRSLDLFWETRVSADPMESSTDSTNLSLVTGGQYEFWADLASSTSWRGGDPEVVAVDLGDGTTTPGVLIETGIYDDGSSSATLDVLDGSGTTAHVSLGVNGPGVDPVPASTTSVPVVTARTSLGAALPGLFTRLDPTAWNELLARAAAASAATDQSMESVMAQKRAANGIEDPSAEGAPPAAPGFATTTTTSVAGPSSTVIGG